MQKPLKFKINLIFKAFLFLFLTNEDIHSQTQIDSLQSIWENTTINDSLRFDAIHKYYYKYTHATPDSTLRITDYHYKLAKEKNSLYQMGNALNEKSYAYYLKGDVSKSSNTLEDAIEMYSNSDNLDMYAVSNSNLGNLYVETKEYLKAYRSFYESLEKFRNLGIKKSEARILFNLGKLFVLVEEFDLGIKYLKKSKEVYKECSNHNMYTKITGEHENALALIHYSKGEYETALEYIKKGIPKLLKKNDISSLQESYLIASKSYRELNQNEYAIEFIEKKIEIDNSFDNQSDKITGLVVKASILLDSDIKKSTQLAEEALKLINKDSNIHFNQMLDLYDILYKTYKRSNKPKLAMSMLENYRVYRDSLESEKFNLKIAKEAITNEYNDRIRLAEQKNKTEQQELKKQIKGMIFISSFVIILIFVFFRFKQIQNKRNLEILLSEIKYLKKLGSSEILVDTKKFQLDKLKIDKFIERKLNQTDWKVLNIILSNPMITNKRISEEIHMSLEGISSSLRRMYQYFDIEDTKYKKVALIHKVIKISNKQL